METTASDRILEHPLVAPLLQQSNSIACHAVGGTVRDALLAIPTTDLDVSVDRDGGLLAETVACSTGGRVVALGGQRFSSYRVVAGEHQLDIWDRQGGDLRSDLARRDLTINSIACDLDHGTLEDPFGGLDDIESQLLRATRLDCFERDPLRVLRLARFQLILEGFSLDAKTAHAATVAGSELFQVAIERIREELTNVLSAATAGPAFTAMERTGALAPVLARISQCAAVTLHERCRRLDANREALGELSALTAWSLDDQVQAALAMLLPAGLSEESLAPDQTACLERAGLATRKASREASRLAALQTPRTEDSFRLFLASNGTRWPIALAVAAAREAVPSRTVAEMTRSLENLGEANPYLLVPIEPLLNGHEVARILKMQPGPAVGEMIRALLREQILGRVGSRAEAEEFVAQARR